MAQRMIAFGPQRVERVLRCRKTRRYFQEGNWTTDPRAAKVHRDGVDAVRTCVAHNLSEIDLVLRAPDAAADLFAVQLR